MNNAKTKIMTWVDALPRVNETQFPARRDEIAKMVAEAEQLMRQADELRGKAYFASLTLEGDARGHWSNAEVEQAKKIAG
ncbi:stable inheritance protein KleA (plasmid) [Escherichia coli]